MDDLIAFLRARLDEDEARTRNLLAHAQQTTLILKDPKLLGRFIPGWHDWPDVERMCTERLAELEAKRRIIDGFSWEAQETRAVQLLALPYADHPDYRPEWQV